MICTKCRGEMNPVKYGEKIEAQRCNDCGALWCLPATLLQMKEEWMSEFLDSGDPKLGKKYDKMTDVPCPGCQSPMLSAPDPQQTHIMLESCSTCSGILFDAGEFTDWKYDTFMDRIRDLVARRK